MQHLVLVTRFPGDGSVLTHCCFGCLLFFPFLLEGLLIMGLSDHGTDGVPVFLFFTPIAGLTVGVVGLLVLRSSRVSMSLSGVTTEIYSPYLPCPRYSSISSHFGHTLVLSSLQVWLTVVQNILLVFTKTYLKYMLLRQKIAISSPGVFSDRICLTNLLQFFLILG